MHYEHGRAEQDLLERPIPELRPIGGWKEVALNPSDEELVALGMFSSAPDIFTSSIYAAEYEDSPYKGGDTLDASVITLFVRESVAARLTHAQQLLPLGYHLVVFDAYRPLEVQQALYDQYYNHLKKLNPTWTDDELSTETQKYVSIPSTDPTRPSPHNTGGSVDLAIFKLPEEVEAEISSIDDRLTELQKHLTKPYATYTAEEEAKSSVLHEFYLLNMKRVGLVKSHAIMLDFGTPFDNGTETSALRYFEEQANQRPLTEQEYEAARNRRMLYQAMTETGMVPYGDEWWHFNAPESQMGAKVLGLDHATFGGMVLSDELRYFEDMRKMHHANFKLITDHLHNGLKLIRPFNMLATTLIELNNEAAVGAMSNPRDTEFPVAVKIAPESEAT